VRVVRRGMLAPTNHSTSCGDEALQHSGRRRIVHAPGREYSPASAPIAAYDRWRRARGVSIDPTRANNQIQGDDR
jgi:hypothetical protein